MLINPDSAHSLTCEDISFAIKSYSPNSFGNPALGCAETYVEDILDISATYGRSRSGPNAQLSPIEIGFA